MKGYSALVKQEITGTKLKGSESLRPFLSALLHTSGTMIINNGGVALELKSEFEFILNAAEDAANALTGIRPRREKFKLIFLEGRGLLTDLGILEQTSVGTALIAGIDRSLIESEKGMVSYLKGAFLGCGSVSILNNGYHLEFAPSSLVLARDISHLLAEFNILSKTLKRKDKHIVYVKDSESVSDTLALLSAVNAVLKLNDIIVSRRVNMNINRITNCDMANLDKTVNTAVSQKRGIELIDKKIGLDNLPEKLKAAAKARLENEDYTYEQLAAALGISKSGLKHRLKKLSELAAGIEEKE